MKISQKVLNNFRKNDWGCGNDNWNIANNHPTMEQRRFLLKIWDAKNGICGNRKITMKDIKNYLEYGNI